MGRFNQTAGAGDADPDKFQMFTRAIREKRALRFVYSGHGKVATKCH